MQKNQDIIFDIERRYFNPELNEKISSKEMGIYLRYLNMKNDYPKFQRNNIILKEMIKKYKQIINFIGKRKINKLNNVFKLNTVNEYYKHKLKITILYENKYYKIALTNQIVKFYFKEISVLKRYRKVNPKYFKSYEKNNFGINLTFTGFILMMNHLFGEFLPLEMTVHKKGTEKMNDLLDESVFIIPISSGIYKKYTWKEYSKERVGLYELKFKSLISSFYYVYLEYYCKDGIFNITNDKKLQDKTLFELHNSGLQKRFF